MKKYIPLLIFLCITNLGYSQFGVSYEQTQIFSKNGSTIKGFARLNRKDLDFKDENKKNKKNISFSEIDSVKFSVVINKKENIKKDFRLDCIEIEPKSKNKKEYVLAELLFEKEKIKIYGVYMLSGGGFAMGAGNGGQVSVSNIKVNFDGNNYEYFYCYIKNEKHPRVMYDFIGLKPFRIMASDCFMDCKELSEKIRNKIFTKDNIIEIGNFYNETCM